jgi:hypothetical protein
MVKLAVTNWLSAQRFGANDHYRKELAILAERFHLTPLPTCPGMSTMSIEASNPRD